MRYSSSPAEIDGHSCILENVFPSIDYRDFVKPKIKPFFMLRARLDVLHSVTTWTGIIRLRYVRQHTCEQHESRLYYPPVWILCKCHGAWKEQVSGSDFSCLNTLTTNYKRVDISPLSLTTSWVISWSGRRGMEGAATPFHTDIMGWACDPIHTTTSTAEQLESSCRLFFSRSRARKKSKTKKKEKKRKYRGKKKRNLPLGAPALSQAVHLTLLLSPGPQVSGSDCAWVQSSMLFKQTNASFEMPVAPAVSHLDILIGHKLNLGVCLLTFWK